jgi:hypothetical protein
VTPTQIALNLFAYTVFTAGPLFVWFSRYNVPALTKIPFVVTAYLLPVSIIPFDVLYGSDTVELLTNINAVGGLAMLAGLFLGFRYGPSPTAFNALVPPRSGQRSLNRIRFNVHMVLALGVAGMVFCFAWTGVVPMFAEDPFLAKFFKGPYKEKYDQISIVFRLAQFALITLIPLGIAIGIDKRDRLLAVVVLSSMSVLAISLTRAPVLEGILLYLTILATKSRARTLQVLFGSIMVYLVGSFVYLILGLVEGADNLAENLTFGAPDIIDHLSFLQKFDPSTDLTYGLTFFGGLIPGTFKYNPAVFSLAISNPSADIAEISSGGFRMPASLWGYASYSWTGVVAIPFLSGLISGAGTRILRDRMKGAGTVEMMILVLWYQIIVGFAASFYAMFYFGVVSIVLFLWVLGRWRLQRHAL